MGPELDELDTLIRDKDKYRELRQILLKAMSQVTSGKGEERHGNGQRWEQQRWARVASGVGPGFLLGQAIKKIEEAQGFDDPKRIERELLGAINYTAMAVYYYNNMTTHSCRTGD